VFRAYKKLERVGVLGINKRNGDYISRYNHRSFYPLVDNKLETKKLAIAAGILVPELYARIDFPSQIESLTKLFSERDSFVVKPARGSGGEGILVIGKQLPSGFRLVSGKTISDEHFRHHILDILGGLYSLGGHPDSVIIEYRVDFDPVFEAISYRGVPDIRIIVFLGVPVMAMIRLPTMTSGGRANLHQGAIGCGIDIARGATLSAVSGNSIISEHPDTGASIQGVSIPYWNDLLTTASRTYELTKLGYQGVDFVIDRTLGPMMLELNARPGLNIQLANQAGLTPRLKLVEQQITELGSTVEKVAFAQRSFATSELTTTSSMELA
jgi:alpha-L-glutamate ligase-like protein